LGINIIIISEKRCKIGLMYEKTDVMIILTIRNLKVLIFNSFFAETAALGIKKLKWITIVLSITIIFLGELYLAFEFFSSIHLLINFVLCSM